MEVAMSVQFDELADFRPAHFGLLWERWRGRYPRIEHKPPLPSVVELFGVSGTRRAEVVVAESGFPVGRHWFLSEDGQELVQVQPDKFVLNWRKVAKETSYPRYDVLRGLFIEELTTFLQFVEDEGIGEFNPTQAELTYVNHIPVQGALGSEITRIIAPWSGRATDLFLPDLEDCRLQWQYKFQEDGKPIGRLHVQIQSVIRAADKRRLLTLQLTGRGAPIGKGEKGVLELTDRAHEWIVRGFTSLTTTDAHTLWEREQ
jgi:uncharacterized protein (TIGR04255 family)